MTVVADAPAHPPSADAGDAGTNATARAQRIRAAFAAAGADGRAAFIPYVVAGYPDPESSLANALAAVDAGADLIEVGLPYSDPVADGTTLQRAAMQALRAGASFERSRALVADLHRARPSVPIVAMGYTNQVAGGDEGRARLRQLADAGASGVILADLTPDEGDAIEASARDADVALVYLVTPTTTAARRATIGARSGGFLYAVSLVGVTGARQSLSTGIVPFLQAIREMSAVPVAVGFGVARPEHVRRLAPHTDGVIVASALVDALGPDGRDVSRLTSLARSLREATARARGERSRP